MPGGRPTKYKKEYCQKLIDFFDREPEPTRWKRTYYSNGIVKSEEPVTDIPQDLPTFQGFARMLGVNVDTLHEWSAKHKEFSEAYTRAKQIQEDIWLRESLSGRYNAQFAKFFGVNCLGYRDKVEQETTITDYTMEFGGMSKGEIDEISG